MAGQALTLPQALDRAISAYKAGNFVEAEKICQQIISVKQDFFPALHLLAAIQASMGKNDLALASYDRALSVRPDDAEALYNRGNALKKLNRNEEALASYDRVLSVRPAHAEALTNRGLALQEMKRYDEALASYDRALTVRPDYAEALFNRGNALTELKRCEEALASYDRALSSRPNDAKALYNRGNILQELRRYEEALASYDRALSLRPGYAEALNNRGLALQKLTRCDEALASYDRALSVRPDYAEALYNRGIALHEMKRLDEALASYDRALSVRPNYPEALYNRGNALMELNRPDEALASYDRAVSLRPDHAEALNNRGNALNELKRYEEALASYDRALSVRPDYAEALNNRGNVLKKLRRLDEALASYDRALAAKPDQAHALSGAADCAMNLCDWDRRTKFAGELAAHVLGKKSSVSPFVFLGYSGDPALQLQCARNYVENEVASPPRLLWTGETWRHDKLRVAYLSADFRAHPMGYLTAGLFERHDRSRFEIMGVSFGIDDGSEIRKRVLAAFDECHDVRRRSDQEVAKLLHDRQVDIAVNLTGHIADARPGIFAHRPAPIQVSYLAYPGTMGADFIDYVVADEVVAPFEDQRFYTERIVHLPDCYFVTDDQLKIADGTPTRAAMGLPERGFVFCCFNNNWKIAPEVFDVWMRLLHLVEGSVLWLLRASEGAERNLRKEARRRGIEPSRLVFSVRLPLDEHLARHRLADLFLDTLPYNAHTTAADALWAGLPVLTCKGEAFAGRVAASLLRAVGLPELITANNEEYEALALKLARERALLAGIKAKLARQRDTYPLFDTPRFARHIEAAYTTMWEIWQRGERPSSFSVEPID